MQENKILVVGNGYDVACGLQSRFTDFFNPMLSRYLYHIKNISNAKNKINTIEKFYTLLDENFISKFCHQIPLNEDEENFFKTDFSLLLLKKFYPFAYVLINSLFYSPTKISPIYNITSNDKSNIYLSDDERDLRDILEKFRIHYNSDKQVKLLWLDIEQLISILVQNKKILPTQSKMSSADLDKFERIISNSEKGSNSSLITPPYNIQSCIEGLKLFRKLFCEYLSKQESRFIKNGTLNNKPPLKNKFDKVISLNYTKLFEKSLSSSSSDNICYVHGSLIKQNIVIGTESFYYNENSRENTNISHVPFFKFFQRVLFNTDDAYLNWIKRTDYTLTFYGFSFSQNDFDLIKDLFMDDNEEIRKNLKYVEIYYLEEDDRYSYLINLAMCLNKKSLLTVKEKLKFIHIPKKNLR